MTLDGEACYRALVARDARFDGVFFVAVETTGVYCRPVCRAKTPRRDRCVFYARAAEAERDGFRACFRCRPERAPGGANVDAISRLVRDAVGRIDAGALGHGGLDALAAELGVSARHLRRAVHKELGVTPLELWATRRLALARELLLDTELPITELAFACGFGSIRRFNAAFAARYGRAPQELRKAGRHEASNQLALTLEARAPYDFAALLEFLAQRAIVGLEHVADGTYVRTARIDGRTGFFAVSAGPREATLRLELHGSLAPALMPLVARIRRMFDLDAQPEPIAVHLRADPLLRPLLERRPGLRIAGAFDPFEALMRALFGQRVSVAAARTLTARFVRLMGEPLVTAHPALDLCFPSAERVARASDAELDGLGLGRARGRALREIARAWPEGALLDPAQLEALPGVGPWTRDYVALRGLGAPDAFPDGDLVLRRALGDLTPGACRARAERWRPWRGYAAMQLWAQQHEERHESSTHALRRNRNAARTARRHA
jgi:AraC family transcriptional regulator of adaptative response / DNA-3-methyladenine glycosylase II